MKITFCGGARTVTGSSFLLETAGKKILLDCGMFQGDKRLRERNLGNYPYNPAEIDWIVLTHAHIDHCGLLPRLIKDGFSGRVLATKATVDLAGIMLPDSAYVQVMEAEWLNRKNERAGRPPVEPLYTVEEAYASLDCFQGADYHVTVPLTPEIAVKLYDAGHILGSAIVEIQFTGNGTREKLVFSGDLGKSHQPIIRNPDVLEAADYLVLEGTYGAREHEQESEKLETLSRVITETFRAGGNVIVPSFAVGRTQELLYSLNQLMTEQRIPRLPIYIDSPLAISATEVFARHPECFDVQMRLLLRNGKNPFNFPEVTFTRKTEESQALNRLPGGALIISASGMCEAGRIKHHLKHNLWRRESTVLFVGYQAEGTLGRRIKDGAQKVRIFGEEIAVRARIAAIEGFSAHADRSELLSWAGKFLQKPKQIILVHGEDEALTSLSSDIERELKIPAYIPKYLESLELEF
jgi:metallo-beta-lactamase family protein